MLFLLLSLLTFAVTLITVLITPARDDDSNYWPRTAAKWIIVFLSLIGLLLLTAYAFPPGIILFPVLIASLIAHQATSRKATALYIVSTIGTCMRQNLPLAMALQNEAGQQTDTQARTLRRISQWLVKGYNISDAIKLGYPKCPPDILAMLTVAEKTNQLPQAAKTIEAELIQKGQENTKIKPFDPVYPVTVLVIAFLIMSGLMVFIVPTFAEVLMDVSEGKASLPVPTQILLNITSFIFRANVFLILFCLLVIIGGIATYVRYRPRRPEKPRLLSKIFDTCKWHLPILHWFELNYSTLRTIGVMRTFLQAGCTVNQMIANAINLDINYCFRKRLARWLEKVEHGENISDSAKKCGIGKSIAWAFDEKINRGNTPAILEMLEDFYRSTYKYRINITGSITEPVMVLMLGAMVGFVVYAMFLPMVNMILITAGDYIP
ncbi:MAG: type II secretion system F family protein [Sedimentisphaerales bacterium]|nr:type II secretion system F family protein [Sedimentisphaerales bacterium]